MKQALAFPRCDCIRVVVHAARKVASTIREAKRRKARSSTCPHQIGCGRVLSGGRSPSGAPPRLSPATRRSADSAPGHASWDVDPAGATRLHLSQSRDCTSRTGRSTGVTDARSRPGAECKSARRHRSRSVFRLAFRKASLNERDCHLHILFGYLCQLKRDILREPIGCFCAHDSPPPIRDIVGAEKRPKTPPRNNKPGSLCDGHERWPARPLQCVDA